MILYLTIGFSLSTLGLALGILLTLLERYTNYVKFLKGGAPVSSVYVWEEIGDCFLGWALFGLLWLPILVIGGGVAVLGLLAMGGDYLVKAILEKIYK